MASSEHLDRLGVQFYADNYDALLRLCKKLTRRVSPQIRQQLIEDAMHEAMRTVPMAMSTYHQNGATLRTHVLGSVRWYVWKMLTKRMNDPKVFCDEDDVAEIEDAQITDSQTSITELLQRDEVESILCRMCAPQAELLRWRFIDGMEYKEIAELLGCATSGAHRFVSEALEAARVIAKVRD